MKSTMKIYRNELKATEWKGSEVTYCKRRCWIHNLLLPGLAALIVDVDGQRGEDQQKLLIVDLDGAQGVQRMVRDERDGRMIRLDQGHGMLVSHQTVNGKARRITDDQTSVRYGVETLRRRRQQNVPQTLVTGFRSSDFEQQYLHSQPIQCHSHINHHLIYHFQCLSLSDPNH